ncbi:S-adenosyl-L-methionine-dependent methyltransferase [Russula earlei]|uniref:S-adenosyl-L-methionine-dependent methyltransferase n=1 Tax=Russula earlei TaxID=71964 RepID=A0ACC0UDD6_9AGAM|nr:S-adenosyl-L-methionine-dependent methyltransferase [Russula earlei]
MCVKCVPPELVDLTPNDHDRYFRVVNGRRCNTLNPWYVMPADEDELRRFELFHRMIRFVFDDKNYVGPVETVLSPDRDTGGERLRVLDMGTGGGLWAVDMADEFPHVDVTGVDLAPLQPRNVPSNCTFELCDLDCHCLPYPSNSYDVVHARNMHSGIHDYPQFLSELTRILRPGGVLILIEFDLRPVVDGRFTLADAKSGIPGWCAVAEEVQRALRMRGVDTTVPERMGELVHGMGRYDHVFQQHADIPVGFWPKDPTLLTVGQLAWMESDLLILAMRPLLLASGLDEKEVKMLTEAAQRDLYYPLVHIETRLHVVHAIKSV